MKYVFLLILTSACYLGYGQFFIGLTEQEARATIQSTSPTATIRREIWVDSIAVLLWKDESLHTSSWVMLKHDYVFTLAVQPLNEETLNSWMDMISKSGFVKVSETEWNQYTKHGVVKIKLEYIKGDTPVISFKELPR